MTDEHPTTGSRRPRPVLSCLQCRRKKLKCDRLLPCQQCLKLSQPSLCSYAPGQEPERRASPSTSERATKKPRRDQSTESPHSPIDAHNDLHERVRKLEEALRFQRLTQSAELLNKRIPPPLLEQDRPSEGLGHVEASYPIDEDGSVFKKFPEAIQFYRSLKVQSSEPHVRAMSMNLVALDRAVTMPQKSGANVITIQKDLTNLINHMVHLFPPPSVRGKLIELYFDNFEHCARILHKTFFLLENREFDQGEMGPEQMEYFVPALLGVLCIASNLNIYPECNLHALCTPEDGVGATDLLDDWYDLVTRQVGPIVPVIQARLLGLQFQRHRNSEANKLWISSAQLIRQAMTQSLHQEPPADMNNFEVEIRRGLWLTILEQDLALAIQCGMPPLCPPYDLPPPTNCDDSELSVFSTAKPVEHPTHQWTDGLCQHILGATFNQRLEAYRHRFAPKTSSHYAKTLEYTKKLEASLRELPPQFRLDHASNTPGRLMAQMDLDMTLRRPLIAAYAPYARANPVANMYREMRIPWVQSNLIVVCFQDLFDPLYPAIDVPRPIGYWDFYYTAYRYEVIQSLEAVLIEAKYLKESEPVSTSIDLSAQNNTAGASPVKFMPWDFPAIMKSIEDTLSPMTRQVGPHRGDLRTVIRYSVLYDCLRTPKLINAVTNILDGLQSLTSAVWKRLEREGCTIEAGSNIGPFTDGNSEWLMRFLRFED